MIQDDLKKRAKQFAHDCVKLASSLPNTFLGNHIKNQLIRSATSVACNYRAVCVAQSKPSFISKISIVTEEIDESCFWLEFIIDENLIGSELVAPLFKESNDLTAIFIASRKTAQNRNKQLSINN